MATVVYALFVDDERSEAAAGELARNCDEHPTFAVQSHTSAPLDGNYLPEAATEVGRNTLVAMIVGGIVGLLVGSILPQVVDVLGLTSGIGAVFGLLTGTLSGMLGGMMAGTRAPKPELRELAEQLGEGRVLLTIAVDDPGHVEVVEDVLERFDGEEIGSC